MGEVVIFVTGLPRTGTSMTCGALAACGVDFGQDFYLVGPSTYCPTGAFENHAARILLHRFLGGLGVDPRGQLTLPPRHAEVVVPLRFEIPEVEALKDPKFTLVWHHLHEGYPNAKWIVTRRDRSHTIDSWMRTDFMDAYSSRVQWFDFHEQWEARLDDLVTGPADTIEVFPDACDPSFVKDAVDFVGREYSRSAVSGALVPAIWHGPSISIGASE
jgi:hypothetical protein